VDILFVGNQAASWSSCSLISWTPSATLLSDGSRVRTNWTGLPAQSVFSGSLVPAGTYEFGAITALSNNKVYPLSIWQPSPTTDLNPIWASSSMIAEEIEHECSIFTLLPIVVERGKASSGAQKTDWMVVLSPIFVLLPTRTALERPSMTAPKPT